MQTASFWICFRVTESTITTLNVTVRASFLRDTKIIISPLLIVYFKCISLMSIERIFAFLRISTLDVFPVVYFRLKEMTYK